MSDAGSGPPPIDETKARDCVGKYILIGLSYTDEHGTVVERQQLHGRIVSADAHRGFVIELAGRRSGETYSLPPDMRSFKEAQPGSYRLRSTGEIIESPDLVANWIVRRWTSRGDDPAGDD